MKFDDRQIARIWLEIRSDLGLTVDDRTRVLKRRWVDKHWFVKFGYFGEPRRLARDMFAKWWASPTPDFHTFVAADLSSDSPDPYLMHIVQRVVADRLA